MMFSPQAYSWLASLNSHTFNASQDSAYGVCVCVLVFQML